jgi:C-terminal processing protease CtpA/Prc
VAPLALAAQQLTATQRAQAVATVWAEARYNFAWWDRVRADWDSALGANLRLAAEPQTDLLFYRRLCRQVALLGDAHATVIPPPALRSRIARPPLLLKSVERRPLILDYASNDEMRVARPERLAEIVAVQGIPAETWIRDSVLPEISAATAADRWRRAVAAMLQGEKGTPLHLSLKLPGGGMRGISVTRSVSLNDRWPLERPALEIDSLSDGVVVVRLNSLAEEDVVRQFDRAFHDFAVVRGLVLDLRDLTEGRNRHGYDLLARLVPQPFVTVRWRTPQHRAGFHAAGPADSASTWYTGGPDTIAPRSDAPAYAGPAAVLAAAGTAGPGEDLLVAFRNAGRGVIVGETSAGSPGEAVAFPLPKNWSIQLSVRRDAFPDGVDFVGKGITPEIQVAVTMADVLAGRDATLEKAREYLGGKRRQ